MEDSMPTVGYNLISPETVNPEAIAAAQEQTQQQAQQQTAGADFSGAGEVVGVGADVASSIVPDIEGSGDVIGEFFGGVAEAAGGALEFIGDLLGGL